MARTGAQRQAGYMDRIRQAAMAAADLPQQVAELQRHNAALEHRISRLEQRDAVPEPQRRARPRSNLERAP